MKLYRFDQEVGKPIDAHHSTNFFLSPISRIMKEHVEVMQIACMHLTKGGLIGGHEAAVLQMMIVVEGEGRVRGEDRIELTIRKGQIALWEAGEWHETSTEDGMMAIIVESDQLKPYKTLPLVQD